MKYACRSGNMGLEQGVPQRVLSHYAGAGSQGFSLGDRDSHGSAGHLVLPLIPLLCSCRTGSLAVTTSVS